MKRYRILILHRHPLFAEGIASLLRQREGVEVKAILCNEPEGKIGLGAFEPDVVVMEDGRVNSWEPYLQEILDCNPDVIIIRLRLGDNTAILYCNRRIRLTTAEDLWTAIEVGTRFSRNRGAQKSLWRKPRRRGLE